MIVLEDAVKVASSLADESVDAEIVDPPYNIGKDFGNASDKQTLTEYVNWVNLWLPHCQRILKPTGTGFIYGYSEILAHISVNIDLPHRWLIWHYTNKNDHCTFWQRSHQSIIVFWKDDKKRIFNSDEAREPYTDAFLKSFPGKSRPVTHGRFNHGRTTPTVYKAHELGAAGRDVIKVPALSGGSGARERIFFCQTCNDVFIGGKSNHLQQQHIIEEHPTQKPMQLTKKLLRSCLPLGAESPKVFIPFAGSGSECLYCAQQGLEFIASDITESYVKWGNRLIEKYAKEK